MLPKLLIVDDNPVNLEILEETLEDLDISFLQATSGQAALNLLSEHEVALVMMDVQMPGMDGFETLRRMREVPDWAFIPVIFITAVHTEDDAVVEGIETGAVDFLPKPFDARVLQGKVRILIDLYNERKRLEHEIQRRRKVEQELLAAKEAAELANRSKSEFLANMSHDIRTPMNAILGMADMLRETPLNDEQAKYINIFQSAGRNLLGLINGILDLSKIERGHLTFEETAFNLPELVENTCEMFALSAHEKGLELTIEISPHVPEQVVGDPGRLRQVLSNMIGNAVKFTHHGEVVVIVKPVPTVIKIADLHRVSLEFSVHDTGIGISPDNLERIFSSFQQGDSSTTRKYGGTGLGLTICRKLVETMGGAICVESEPGAGSCFQFQCDFDLAADRHETAETSPFLDGINVLVLSRNQAICRMLSQTIGAWGGAIEPLEPGEDPLVKMHSEPSEGGRKVVIIDARLPEMAGLELLKQFQAHPVSDLHCLVLLTTTNSHQQIDHLNRFNIHHYLIKPLKRADLRQQLKAVLGQKRPANQMTTEMNETAHTEQSSPKHILLVDDSQDNRLLIQVYLKKSGHSLSTAENGREGLEQFKSGDFDLVLMDIQMPVMDGYEATGEIRRWEAQTGRQRTRIIALTANAMEEDTKASIDAGCDGHLTKPISKARLLETIAENST